MPNIVRLYWHFVLSAYRWCCTFNKIVNEKFNRLLFIPRRIPIWISSYRARRNNLYTTLCFSYVDDGSSFNTTWRRQSDKDIRTMYMSWCIVENGLKERITLTICAKGTWEKAISMCRPNTHNRRPRYACWADFPWKVYGLQITSPKPKYPDKPPRLIRPSNWTQHISDRIIDKCILVFMAMDQLFFGSITRDGCAVRKNAADTADRVQGWREPFIVTDPVPSHVERNRLTYLFIAMPTFAGYVNYSMPIQISSQHDELFYGTADNKALTT